MIFISKIRKRIIATAAKMRAYLRSERADRADILLAHRVVARRRLPSPHQWRLVGRVLKPGEKHALRLAAYTVTVGIFFLVGRWTLSHAILVPASGGEYREGIVGAPRAINPVLAGGNDVDQDILKLVFSGLYKRDADGDLILDLAERVDVSADGNTYTFVLKNDVVFHDGKPVTAADVVFTMNAILDPAWKSPLANNLRGTNARAMDERVVSISADKPAYLPSLLTFGILPKHVWENVKTNTLAFSDLNLKPVGSGPFKFEKFTRDAQGNILTYTLHSTKQSDAKLDRITFKFFDNYDTAADKLTGNAVDGLNFVPPAKREAIRSIPGISVHVPALSQYTAIFFNPKKDPALADTNIRKALAMAIDRDKIVNEALDKLGTLRDSPLISGMTGDDTKITIYSYDPSAASGLLDKAGYTLDPTSKIRTKSTTIPAKTNKDKPVTTASELEITLATINTDENRKAAAIIAEGWAALGIKTDIVTAAADSIQKSIIKPREYDALLFGEILGPNSDPFPFWHSSQATDGLNLAEYSNRRVDELLEKSQVASSDEARGVLLSEFEQIITAEVPAIFLYQPGYLYPQSSKIKGFDVRLITTPANRFANVSAWYRKLKLAFK